VIYVGLDLALCETGMVKIWEANTGRALITTKTRGVDRLDYICNEIILRIPPKDYYIGIENYAYGRPNQAHQIGELHGALKHLFFRFQIEYNLYAPKSIKKFASGKGNAKKELLIRDVFKRWGFETDNNNLADAYAIAKLTEAHHKVLTCEAAIEDYPVFQQEVLRGILNPTPKKRRKKKELI